MPSVPLAAAFDVSAPRYLHRGCERADHLLSVGSRTDYKQIARRWDRRRRPRANAGGTVCASSAATPNSPSAHATSAASAKRTSTEARQAARRYRRVAAAPKVRRRDPVTVHDPAVTSERLFLQRLPFFGGEGRQPSPPEHLVDLDPRCPGGSRELACEGALARPSRTNDQHAYRHT